MTTSVSTLSDHNSDSLPVADCGRSVFAGGDSESMQKNGNHRKRPRAQGEVIDVDSLDEITPVIRPPRSTPLASVQPFGNTQSRPSPVITQGPHDLEAEELSDPSVSVVDLFRRYNTQYFWGSLHGVFVEFSKRMTSCAGTCTFRGKLGGCRIALSEPLLKFRPRSDLLSTLLHEMIHAFLFMTEGIAARDGHDGHGPKFLSHAARINMAECGRVNITPYHTFIDEVELYRVHHWQCSKCSRLIKRAMNRAPAPRDPWWPRHQMMCGGNFVKIKEPEKMKKWKRPKKFFGAYGVDPSDKSAPLPPPGVILTQRVEDMLLSKPKTVACPVCNTQIAERLMNQHLDECLSPNLFSQDPTPASGTGNHAEEPIVVPDDGTVVPLSGQLFRERHFSSGSAIRRGSSGGPSLNSHSGGQGVNSLKDGRDRAGNGELNSNTYLAKPSHDWAHVKAASIDQTSVVSALQVLFGGADALMSYAIRGKALSPLKPAVSPKSHEPYSLFDSMSETNGEVPIKPLCVEPTWQELVDEVQMRFGVCGYGLASSDIQQVPEELSKVETCSGPSLQFAVSERHAKLDKSDTEREPARKKFKNVRQWHTGADCAPKPGRSGPETGTSAATRAVVHPSSSPQNLDRVGPSSSPVIIPIASTVRNLNHNFESPKTARVVSPFSNPAQPQVQEAEAARDVDGRGSLSLGNAASANVGNRSSTSACPICDSKMRRSELESHVSICLTQTGFEPGFVDGDSPPEPEQANTRTGVPLANSARPRNPIFHNPRDQRMTAPCPICEAQVIREDLASHTAICMTSTGIMDAFS